jgi:hypothetical protein|tara:strand:- start:6 stop:395 length:390 start_codon:yes stop_codon:yes gene_type:complete
MGNIFPRKKNNYNYISNDNLLLSNIQERLDQYDERSIDINNIVNVLKSNYLSITKDFRIQITDLKKDYNELDKKCIKIDKEFRSLSIINKTQEHKIIELEGKLLQIEQEDIFVDKNQEIENSSQYFELK